MNTSKAFTIVELLIVVAIIAVIAAIVLQNVSNYNNKGKNTAIKQEMSNLYTYSVVWYEANSKYDGFGSDSLFDAHETAIESAGGFFTYTKGPWVGSYQRYCAVAKLLVESNTPSNSSICIDSSGYKKITQTTPWANRCTLGVCSD